MAKRARNELAGPLRDVVYIFEREGERGGGIWWLILECGHSVARKRYVGNTNSAAIHLLYRPLQEKLAPKRCQCWHCETGVAKTDPWITIRAFGGPTP